MCLIVVAHRVTDELPLVVAANRDEDHERPTIPAHFWPDAPETLGGRDGLHGGSWLAITRGGRFAAVTNLRGAVRAPESRSRGTLVGDFVRGTVAPETYAEEVAGHVDEYAGFHLLVAEVGGRLVQLSVGPRPSALGPRSTARGRVVASEGRGPRTEGRITVLEPGIHGLSNALLGERWPKVEVAEEAMRRALRDPESLMTFLSTTPDIFVRGERYGTRSSTVIVVRRDAIEFTEQNFTREGVADGIARQFRFAR